MVEVDGWLYRCKHCHRIVPSEDAALEVHSEDVSGFVVRCIRCNRWAAGRARNAMQARKKKAEYLLVMLKKKPMAPQPCYVYKATVIRVIDGDTLVVQIDLGCHISITQSVRLAELDAPEKSNQRGRDALAWVSNMVPAGTEVVIETRLNRTDKYGRMLGTVWIGETCLNKAVVAAGWVKRADDGATLLVPK